jgi:hypothetical protein
MEQRNLETFRSSFAAVWGIERGIESGIENRQAYLKRNIY